VTHINSALIREFRCLLRDYFDAQRDDWSPENIDPFTSRILEFVDSHPAEREALEELVAFLFVDADPGLEELLAALVPRAGFDGLRDEVVLLGQRRPRLERTGHVRRLLEAFDTDQL
jgi:hypothetical protein